AMESCLLRTLKNIRRKGGNSGGGQGIGCDATRAAVYQGLDRVETEGRRALARIGEGDTQRIQFSLLRKFLKRAPVDVIALKRRVADRAIELSRYPFSARA
ncbi:MAG: acyl-CoA dehydrogenase, partial [Acidobacteriota bacterium]